MNELIDDVIVNFERFSELLMRGNNKDVNKAFFQLGISVEILKESCGHKPNLFNIAGSLCTCSVIKHEKTCPLYREEIDR